ncbi:hypothetical protein EC973_003871 [Apophysomyces ossiformis]|uniref:Inositol-1-monophosphatase n=1 Tax=Apophysomyces ossiformis TaxID=679940 RepID=A0A8H7ELT5_9FUNG|nr:hypothetical protein EC973_003871 [Apophysomyces ossiformis]
MRHQQEILKEYLKFAIALAKEAGALIKSAVETRMSGSGTSIVMKSNNPSDLVTETDQAVEQFIKTRLAETYPDHRFIGEETMSSGAKTEFTNQPTWIVDPIDGTTNFIHGFPFVAVSIGLTMNKVPVLGVVYNPLLDELYSAAQGLGAYLNETTRLPLFHPTPPLIDLSHCLVATEAGSDRSAAVLSKKIETMHAILRKKGGMDKAGEAHSIRATGSAALNMCCVAKGIIDVYWEIGCWEWDVTAAIVIAQEAGGIVLTGGDQPNKDPVNIFGRKYLAIRAAPDKESQYEIAHQMWNIIPDIDAPRQAVPGGFEL